MEKNLLLVFTFAYVLTEIASNHIENQSLFEIDKKTNFVDKFDINSIEEFTKSKKYVMIMFFERPKNFKRLNAFLFTLSTLFEKKEVFFLQVDVKNASKTQLEKNKVDFFPSFKFYVYGLQKNYTLGLDVDSCRKWIDQHLTAEVQIISNLNHVSEYDSHYIIYVNEVYLTKNPAHFRVLTKLISPIPIFTGLTNEKVEELTGRLKNNFTLIAYRKYDSNLMIIPSNLTVLEKGNLLKEHEFPHVLFCSKKAKELIIHQKLPVLIFFTRDQNKNGMDIVLESASSYSSFIKILVVYWEDETQEAIFFKNFLAVESPESLRILTLHDGIKRYNFIGQLKPKDIHYYLKNYVTNNIKPYSIHENLAGNEELNGVKRANQIIYKRMVKNPIINALFYVHLEEHFGFDEHLMQLKIVNSVFRRNKNFKIYLFDHRKNDLDGFFHEKVPFIFLMTVNGELEYFEGEIKAENIVRFVLKNIPLLKLSEPVLNSEIDDSL